MLPIPIDVLEHILGHLDEASLAKICQLNKICCFYSQDVLYRELRIDGYSEVLETLAQSTHLARRVRLFRISFICTKQKIPDELLCKSLQNMTNLRALRIFGLDLSVLDQCTFRLVSFRTSHHHPHHLVPFLHSQPSLKDVALGLSFSNDVAFASTCLPNLTCIFAGSHNSSQIDQ
jgi:hypothetical protein